MSKKLTGWKTKGMNRDLSVSAFNPEFAYENINLRLSTNEHNTLMSWVNERGPKSIVITNEDNSSLEVVGHPVGTAVLNHYLVLFTTDNNGTDSIYKFWDFKDDACTGKLLYQGNLKLSTYYPLETLVSYESDRVQKVYWTDGKNQPRVINIAQNNLGKPSHFFDFINEIQLTESVTVQKILGGSGVFSPGVIQYAFTYYNMYGQESNIFHVTPLYYISFPDRGASPEEKVDNAFRITLTDVDTTFDYLRIYSIQRTSINATPVVKRIQDISLKDLKINTVSYTDTGASGDTVDPTELLYKGGTPISALTLEQKDNTLFLGNIRELESKEVAAEIGENNYQIKCTHRKIQPLQDSSSSYKYANQLTSVEVAGDEPTLNTVPCSGFKGGQDYRLGIQFQSKTGRWSTPVYLEDVTQVNYAYEDNANICLPQFTLTITNDNLVDYLKNKGFVRMRGLVVLPSARDRNVVCQGIGCPTLKANETPYYQSSWFFRDAFNVDSVDIDGAVSPVYTGVLSYCPSINPSINPPVNWDPSGIRNVEIEGIYDTDNQFNIEEEFFTLYSPDVEFDTAAIVQDFTDTEVVKMDDSDVKFSHTYSDIDIQTETPTINNGGSGFIHKTFSMTGSKGIISGLFYEDWLVDDIIDDDGIVERYQAFDKQKSPMKWLVYLWNKDGSLNNDINRPSNMGVTTAKLKKKIISNLRYADGLNIDGASWTNAINSDTPKLFNSEEIAALKFDKDAIYFGNIDTVLTPDESDGMYFAFKIAGNNGLVTPDVNTPFNSNDWWKISSNSSAESSGPTLYMWTEGGGWVENKPSGLADDTFLESIDLVRKKDMVRMKYKSCPHLAFPINTSLSGLHLMEVRKEPIDPFGGTSNDALRENVWIPCGEPVEISTASKVNYSWGDTYYQRYDCLKTYAFTEEDVNQVVEIGSFMLETYVNIDGRYDKNRGQLNNLHMSPRNFNLLNPVYSQVNNFFSYRIMPEDYYKNYAYPNQITWSKTKQSGADVDQWTNITLASVLELDGDKGNINKLIRFNDQLISFQDTGISQILYNENTQISTTEGVPIEIQNSGKVQGKRYFTNTVGCSNKWSMATSPAGIYFMSSHDRCIYVFNGQLQNISVNMGMNTWCKQNIPGPSNKWNPLDFGTTWVRYIPAADNSGAVFAPSLMPLTDPVDTFDFTYDYTFHPAEPVGPEPEPDPQIPEDEDEPIPETITGLMGSFVSYYDQQNQELLFINNKTSLTFSERVGAFTSFYDYENTPYFCNLDNHGIWVRNDGTLWKHQGGEYCNFFGENKPYSTILIGNAEPQIDKIFTNLEFRACVDGEGVTSNNHHTPFLPFDYLETWNEYQHGLARLLNRPGYLGMLHHTLDNLSSLKRKFRIWRCDIPRDNAIGAITDPFDFTFDFTFHSTISYKHSMDRMRNPWLYIKLQKVASSNGTTLPRTEIHDVVMTYFA